MCECIPSLSMPIAGYWALRGGFTPRANPRYPNAHFPQQDMFRQPRSEFFVSFYHRSQESAKMFDAMKRRIPLSKNVTLTIEIPNAEHAGMIERMEAWCDEDSIPQIMQDTGVLIQFPDLAPDAKNGNDYVNRVGLVTLTGPLANVEQARIRIRNFTPVAISFPLKTLKPNILMKDVKSVIDKAIAEKLINFPNLEIMVQSSQLSKDPVPSCVVRGVPSHEGDICNACTALHRLLLDTTNDNEHVNLADLRTLLNCFRVQGSAKIFSTVMDIPAVQQLAVTGVPDGYLIRTISLETNAIIYFPTVADRHFGATVFYLYGSVHAIMKARKYIQGLLPVRLIFDVENNDLLSPVDASSRELFLRDTERDLSVMVRKSRLEGEQLMTNDTLRNIVTIESEEHNLTNVYAMRHQLLRNSALENEPLVTTKDFDFFKNDFKARIAENNKIIAENSNDSLAKASSLLYSQLNRNKQSSSLPAVPVLSPPTINDIASLLPPMHICQEILQPLANENAPIALAVGGSAARRRKMEEREITFPASPSSIVRKERSASGGMNISVPQFLDLFRQNESKSIVMIAIDDFERPLPDVSMPRKMEYIRNTDKASATENPNQCPEEYDAGASNADYNLASSTTPENKTEPENLYEKSSVCLQSFVSQSQSLMSSGANVVDALISDQGSTTVAVAAAMLQNSPPQWFQSSDTVEALKSVKYFRHMPRMQEKNTISETFVKQAECAQISMVSSPEKTWQTKKNLPLKSSFMNENCIREYHRDMGANTISDTSRELLAEESGEASCDVRLSSLSVNRNANSLYSVSCGNFAQNSNQHRSLYHNNGITDAYNYRTKRQPSRTRDNTVWENSHYSSSQFHHHYTHSNTREYQGRPTYNSSRWNSNDMVRGGRTMRRPMNYSGGYNSSLSCSQTTWTFSSSGCNEGRRYDNRGMTYMRFKRQFVNGAHLEERGKFDRRRGRCAPFHEEHQHSCVCDQFRKDSEKLNSSVNNITPKLLVKTKTYADTTKRVDIMVLIDEAQRSQNEQSSRSVQHLNRPPLMMKELEKYTGNDDISSKSHTDMAKKSSTEDEKIQNKTLVFFLFIIVIAGFT
uniref:KH_10 domain-containing protein n=1 Tax=Wuchereria bancrofti TaxID=6293 RepID=A0A1I8EWB3_WUCBA